MSIKLGQIVKNLIESEPVRITKITQLGDNVSISYTGINTNKNNNRIIPVTELNNLEIIGIEGAFNFKGNAERFLLCAEAERIQSAYQFDPLFAVNCSVIDALPHQIEAVYKFLLPLPQIRFLLADDTGAGKTIMAGLLLKELIMRGLIQRIMIVTPGGLTKQWQEDEMEVKFNLPFTLVNRSIFSSEPNIFSTADRIVTSIDFISRDDVLAAALGSHWDIIIFDEAHKLSAYEYGEKKEYSRRYAAAYELSKRCEHILLLTATPHRGRDDTFKKLLQILDDDIFATEDLAKDRVREYEHGGINKFFIRRLKEDMKDWDNNPLYKKRFTRTVSYNLTPEEKHLYDEVTDYLTKKKKEADDDKNIHVSLALTVMQRRLASSIYALKNTLHKRLIALQSIIEEVKKNPGIWSQRQKFEGFDVDNIDEYDDLGDEERAGLETILSDPRKFKLFTTAKNLQQIEEESRRVNELVSLADSLYLNNQEEQKFKKLKELLKSEKIIDGEKLVIFTEHKDTLIYLEDRLSRHGGYRIATIHGGKNVDERREAQRQFAQKDTPILIATDAAGEGINLQFCRVLLNWDIPWNPNRLEQRMGRIHRYGQKDDVLVFNLVAGNTREGQVLQRLLQKLDIIRQSLGDDRVYDVIQDVLEDVSLEDIIKSVFNGAQTGFDDFLNEDDEKIKKDFALKIKEQKEKLSHSGINYEEARELKERSDEKRLQPIYIQLFFERAFQYLGGTFRQIGKVYQIIKMPSLVSSYLKDRYNLHLELDDNYFSFDKKVFLEFQSDIQHGTIHYINPGNPLFDSLVHLVRTTFNEDLMRGTVLISPDEKKDYFAYFVKTQVVDARLGHKSGGDMIIDEILSLVIGSSSNDFTCTSPAKFIDLHAPTSFAKPVTPPPSREIADVTAWSFVHVAEAQYEKVRRHVKSDVEKRREYLKDAFTSVIVELTAKMQELQGRAVKGDIKAHEQASALQKKIEEMKMRREDRLDSLDKMLMLSQKEPLVMGCAYVVPLTQIEYKAHYGMSRDDEVESIAMNVAMQYERAQGRTPNDVSAQNEGYDIRSIDPDNIKRYIEVKGRSVTDGVMLSENEMNRLSQLGKSAWLYIVINCKTKPELFRVQNPGNTLHFELKNKGIQYFLPLDEWRAKAEK